MVTANQLASGGCTRLNAVATTKGLGQIRGALKGSWLAKYKLALAWSRAGPALTVPNRLGSLWVMACSVTSQ